QLTTAAHSAITTGARGVTFRLCTVVQERSHVAKQRACMVSPVWQKTPESPAPRTWLFSGRVLLQPNTPLHPALVGSIQL
ncbi:hypothetical protein STEG23_005702, partial [Scotinomys teguina]